MMSLHSGNHLTSTRQLVGQTGGSEAMATDAVRANVNYRLTVSCSPWNFGIVFVYV